MAKPGPVSLASQMGLFTDKETWSRAPEKMRLFVPRAARVVNAPPERNVPLFAGVSQKHRRQTAEPEALYDAVRKLRKAKIPVYAAGRFHQVGDRLLSSAELVVVAASLESEPEDGERRVKG